MYISRCLAPILVFLGFVILDDVLAYVSWLYVLCFGVYIQSKMNILHSVKYDFLFWYSIISILGLLLHLDNFINFGDYYGNAEDDFKFYTNVKNVIDEGFLDTKNVDFFSFVLAIFIYPISLYNEISLLDLLPFNWGLFSLTLLLIDKISLKITGHNVLPIMMFVCVCCRFAVLDTSIRLYRDDLVLFCIILFIYFLISAKANWKLILCLLPIFLLRGGSLIYPLLISVFWYNNNKSHKKILMYTTFAIFIFALIYPIILPFVVMYGSSYNRTSIYQEAFSEMSVDEFETMRHSTVGNSDKYSSLTGNSLFAVVGRGVLSYAFPLKITFWDEVIFHYKLGYVNGFYFFNLIRNMTIVSFVVTTAYLLGGLKCIISKKELFALLCANIVFFIVYLYVSNQYRHSVPFYVVNMVLINFVYYNSKNRLLIRAIMLIMFLLIFCYNVLV